MLGFQEAEFLVRHDSAARLLRDEPHHIDVELFPTDGHLGEETPFDVATDEGVALSLRLVGVAEHGEGQVLIHRLGKRRPAAQQSECAIDERIAATEHHEADGVAQSTEQVRTTWRNAVLQGFVDFRVLETALLILEAFRLGQKSSEIMG